MLDVPSMEVLGRIVEEDSISLAATRYGAAWRERELGPELDTPHNAAALARNLLDCSAWVGDVLDVHCFVNRAWIADLNLLAEFEFPVWRNTYRALAAVGRTAQPMVEQCLVAENDWFAGRRRTDCPGRPVRCCISALLAAHLMRPNV